MKQNVSHCMWLLVAGLGLQLPANLEIRIAIDRYIICAQIKHSAIQMISNLYIGYAQKYVTSTMKKTLSRSLFSCASNAQHSQKV